MKGFIIAFHCDQNRHPYLSLTFKDMALRQIKPYIPGEVASALATLWGKHDFDRLLKRISLEAGIVKRDREVLSFIFGKVTDGESIFLDLMEADIDAYNQGPFANDSPMASVWVTPNSIRLMNPDQFSAEEQNSIISIVTSALFSG